MADISRLVLATAAAALAFVGGIEAQTKGWAPAHAWEALKAAAHHGDAPPLVQAGLQGRQEVACPSGPGTLTILVIGQSHAANHVGELFQSRGHVVNGFRGKCYVARDPLLGAEGWWGNVWTEVGNQAVASGTATNVRLLDAAVGSTTLGQWLPGGDLHQLLPRAATARPDVVAVQFGEQDRLKGSPAAQLTSELVQLARWLDGRGIGAPILVEQESIRCPSNPDTPSWMFDLAAANRAYGRERFYPGPDMDRDISAFSDRFDGCHMSGTGARKMAGLWVRAIRTVRP